MHLSKNLEASAKHVFNHSPDVCIVNLAVQYDLQYNIPKWDCVVVHREL